MESREHKDHLEIEVCLDSLDQRALTDREAQEELRVNLAHKVNLEVKDNEENRE